MDAILTAMEQLDRKPSLTDTRKVQERTVDLDDQKLRFHQNLGGQEYAAYFSGLRQSLTSAWTNMPMMQQMPTWLQVLQASNVNG